MRRIILILITLFIVACSEGEVPSDDSAAPQAQVTTTTLSRDQKVAIQREQTRQKNLREDPCTYEESSTACIQLMDSDDPCLDFPNSQECKVVIEQELEWIEQQEKWDEEAAKNPPKPLRPTIKKACTNLDAIELNVQETSIDEWEVYVIEEDDIYTRNRTLADLFPNEATARAWMNACARRAAGVE